MLVRFLVVVLWFALCTPHPTRTHGMPTISLYDVFRATIVASLNFSTVHQRSLDSVLRQTLTRLDVFLSKAMQTLLLLSG